jgi:hypothetical protein
VKSLPLPTATARAHLANFRDFMARARTTPGTVERLRLRSCAHQALWMVKELRRECPRARRAAMRARSERVASGPLPADLAADLLKDAG